MRFPIHALKIGPESLPEYHDAAQRLEPERAIFAAFEWILSCPIELYVMKLGTQCVTVDQEKLRQRKLHGPIDQCVQNQADSFRSLPIIDCPAYARLRYDFLEMYLINFNIVELRPMAAQALEQLQNVDQAWATIKQEVSWTLDLFAERVNIRGSLEQNTEKLCDAFWNIVHSFVISTRDVQCETPPLNSAKYSVLSNG